MFAIVLLSGVLVIVCVGIHLAFLKGLLVFLSRNNRLRHVHVGVIVLGALVGHMLEIALFGASFFFLSLSERFGAVGGAAEKAIDWGDSLYYSAVTYTSLGFGDLTPTGMLRFLSAVEVLMGVVLVAWTASFLFLVMQKVWQETTAKKTDSPV